jgi:hypothetical protein
MHGKYNVKFENVTFTQWSMKIYRPKRFISMRSALFWDFTQRRMNLSVLSSRDCLTLEDGTDRLSETSVRNYHSTLRKIPEERGSHLHRNRNLRSRFIYILHLSIFQIKMFMPWVKASFGNILLGNFSYKLSTAKSCLEKHASEKDKSLQHLSADEVPCFGKSFSLPCASGLSVVRTEHLKFILRLLSFGFCVSLCMQ